MRILTILFVLFHISIWGQTCPSGNLVLTDQSQIDDFPSDYPGCTNLTGGLTIQESSNGIIINLDSLIDITEIGGSLNIAFNSSLTNLHGLSNLTIVGDRFVISHVPALSNIDGLSNLISTGDFGLNSIDSLFDLNSLTNLTTIDGEISINRVSNIVDLSGLENINSINGRLFLFQNDKLQNLSGLNNLSSINGKLQILNHDVLSDISAIANIDPSSISSPDQNPDIVMSGNDSLGECAIQAICDALDLSSTLAVFNSNDTGCNTLTEVENACAAALPVIWLSPLNASKIDSRVKLEWTVSNQYNNDKFIVERADQSYNFKEIGMLYGELDESNPIEYLFLDKSPHYGLNYYRIKQVNIDQSFSNSNTISISIDQTNSAYGIYPNPNSGIFSVETSRNSMLQIYSGRGVLIKELKIRKGNSQIDLSMFQSGLYTMIFNNEYTERVLIID